LHQLLIRYFNSSVVGGKSEYNGAVHQLFIGFTKDHDLFRKDGRYRILIEFGIPMKLVKIFNMNLKESYSNALIREDLSGALPALNDLRQEDEISTIIFTSSLE
jgi:hypothetical protein